MEVGHHGQLLMLVRIETYMDRFPVEAHVLEKESAGRKGGSDRRKGPDLLRPGRPRVMRQTRRIEDRVDAAESR
jgi:hypothetical protein